MSASDGPAGGGVLTVYTQVQFGELRSGWDRATSGFRGGGGIRRENRRKIVKTIAKTSFSLLVFLRWSVDITKLVRGLPFGQPDEIMKLSWS